MRSEQLNQATQTDGRKKTRTGLENSIFIEKFVYCIHETCLSFLHVFNELEPLTHHLQRSDALFNIAYVELRTKMIQ